MRLVSPVPRPALYAAAVSGSTPMGEADKLKDDYAKKLGKDVIIDDYFDMNKDGLSKLQTMIGNEQIDVVIAPHDVFAKLASFGYFDNLKTTLPAAVDTPIVTTGRQHTNHATESMAMSPMRFITVLYGLS